MRKIFLLLAVISFLGISSCKKESNDGVDCSGSWDNEVMQEIMTAVDTASAAYINSPTPANCIAYKEAYQDYRDALESFLDCSAWTDSQKAELQEQIDNAQDRIDELDCTN